MNQDSLPVDSVAYSGNIFKDGYTRMWTGKPNDYTTIKENITLTDYGAVGDGTTDNHAAFIAALNAAKALNCMLYVPFGDYVIVYPTGTIDATGCTGFYGEGTLIFDTEDEDTSILAWTGTVSLVSTATPVAAGTRTATIGTGHNIAIGETVFLVSNTTKPNLADINKLGQRLTVSEYNSSTGAITFYEDFYYTLSDGYFYHNSYQPRVEVSGITVRTLVNTPRKGIEITWCDFTSNGLTMRGFSRFCLNVSSSRGFIYNYKARDFYYTGSGTSYGLQVSGLSEVEIYGPDIAGGRHAIAHGDVGRWNGDMVGGASGPLFFGAVSKVFGGTLKGDKFAAFDSHGCTRSVYVQGAEIVGTVGVGGDINIVRDCTIRKSVLLFNLNVGRDSVDTSVPRGYYEFEGCTVFATGGLISLTSSVDTLILNNLIVNSENGNTAIIPMISYADSGVSATNLVFQNINILGDSNKDRYSFKVNTGLKVNRIRSNSADFAFELYEDSAQVLSLSDIDITASHGNGIVFRDLSTSGSLAVKCDGLNVTSSSGDNIYLISVDSADLSNVTSKSGSRGIRVSGMTGNFRLSGAFIENNSNHSILFQTSTSAKIAILNLITDANPNFGGAINYMANVAIGAIGWRATSFALTELNTAPASATDSGTTGEIRITAGYIYVCIATNTWVRAALSTW